MTRLLRLCAASLLSLLLGSSGTFAQASIPDPAFETGGAVYELDTRHSLLDFTARHLGFGRVRGTFKEYRAAAFFTPNDLRQSTFRMVARVASIDTQNPNRDDLLKREFFDSGAHPYMTFTSQSIRRSGDGYVMTGRLQIRDVTRTVEIPFRVITLDGLDQWQNRRIVLEGELTIDRNDYNVVYDNGFWNGIVSDEIGIDISFGAARYNALNEIFPWRDRGIATVIRDGVESDGVEATLARVRTLYANDRANWNVGASQFYRAGRALYQRSQFEASEAVFLLALDLLSGTASAEEVADFHIALAEVAWSRRNLDGARQHVRRALARDPMHPAAYVLSQRLE